MSDLISRKALMKYMRDYKWEFALNSDFSKAIEMVDVQPAVELPTWIPCSERLPEDTNEEYYPTVIMTLNDGRTTVGCYRNYDNEWWGDISDGQYSNLTGKVIAWMPLPEPYKGE